MMTKHVTNGPTDICCTSPMSHRTPSGPGDKKHNIAAHLLPFLCGLMSNEASSSSSDSGALGATPSFLSLSVTSSSSPCSLGGL